MVTPDRPVDTRSIAAERRASEASRRDVEDRVPPDPEAIICRTLADLQVLRAVLRYGHVAALYSDSHNVAPRLLADIFETATALTTTSIAHLQRSELENARFHKSVRLETTSG